PAYLLPAPPFFSSYVPPPSEIYTLSLHDALPIFAEDGWLVRRTSLKVRNPGNAPDAFEERILRNFEERFAEGAPVDTLGYYQLRDRKSTRLNSSHVKISYAVFCLK